jgi:hypothetical protein
MRAMRRNVARQFQRRATLRHEVSVRGAVIIQVGEASRSVGCRLIDLSLGGARIELDEDCILPEKVKLTENCRGTVHECSVRWRNGREAGLGFLNPATLSQRKALIEELSQGIAKAMHRNDDG